MFYFCHPLALLKAKGCHSFPTPARVFWIVNKNLSEKSLYWKSIQQTAKKTGSPEAQQKPYTGTVRHPCAVDITVRRPLLTPAGPACGVTCRQLSCILLFPCLFMPLVPDSVLGGNIWLSQPWGQAHSVGTRAVGNNGLPSQHLWWGAVPSQQFPPIEEDTPVRRCWASIPINFHITPRERRWSTEADWRQRSQMPSRSLNLAPCRNGGLGQVKWLA